MFAWNLFKSAVLLCIVTYAKTQHDIYHYPNGQTAARGHYPYVVGFRSSNYDIDSICSGSIIGPKHILTAALCVSDIKPEGENEVDTFKVVVGCADLDSIFCTEYDVAKVTIHPKRNEGRHELAILTLAEEISLDVGARIIPIMQESFVDQSDYEQSEVRRCGWNGRYLHYAAMKVVPQHECQQQYDIKISKNLFCTESVQTTWSSFGGPVVYQEKQVGIVLIFDNDEPFEVHLRTDRYIEFISNVLNEN